MKYHIQIFYGRCPPGSTEPRKLAVVWHGDSVLDKGPIDAMQERYPGAVQREDINVWLELKILHDFHSTAGNPLT